MIVHENHTTADLEEMREMLRTFRGASDLAVGVSSTLWPDEVWTTPALIVSISEHGHYIAVDGDGQVVHGRAQRWVEDEDRMGLVAGYDSDAMLWVEHAAFEEEVQEVRRALTAADLVTVASEVDTLRVQQRAEAAEIVLFDPRPRQERSYWVALQLRGSPGSWEPDCWLATDTSGRTYQWWSSRAEGWREQWLERYDWTRPGLVRFLVEEDERATPWTRSELVAVKARTALNAVEQVRERIVSEVVI